MSSWQWGLAERVLVLVDLVLRARDVCIMVTKLSGLLDSVVGSFLGQGLVLCARVLRRR